MIDFHRVKAAAKSETVLGWCLRFHDTRINPIFISAVTPANLAISYQSFGDANDPCGRCVRLRQYHLFAVRMTPRPSVCILNTIRQHLRRCTAAHFRHTCTRRGPRRRLQRYRFGIARTQAPRNMSILSSICSDVQKRVAGGP